jgi:uncharacterized protein
MKDFINYGEIIENSMRSAVREVLLKIQNNGLQGGHHFVVAFLTKDPAVKLSQKLKNKFPEEMVIVIQHQFKDLKVNDDNFNISLSFDGIYEKITISFAAITSFSDPSMNFGVKFNLYDSDAMSDKDITDISEKKDVDLSQKIISLDDFRKNHD